MIPIIDTHQHLILNDRWPYSWTDDLPALKGKGFTLKDYGKLTRGAGVAYTLFMETSPDYPHWLEETRSVYAMLEDPATPMIGAITNCSPEGENFQAFLDEYDHPKRVGLRRILHVADDEISRSEHFRSNIRLLADRDLTFDMCFFARQLPIALELAQACPNVQFILDHCGVPDIANDALDPWREDIKTLSNCGNVACKISGVLAYCKPDDATIEAVTPYVEHAIECFGWDRVLWGGDWPVCTITSTLPEWISISRQIVSQEDEANQKKLFYDNALKIYGAKI